MKILLKLIGYGWAFIGAGNIVYAGLNDEVGQGLMMFGIIFNFMVFILPGLMVGGIGSAISSKEKKA